MKVCLFFTPLASATAGIPSAEPLVWVDGDVPDEAVLSFLRLAKPRFSAIQAAVSRGRHSLGWIEFDLSRILGLSRCHPITLAVFMAMCMQDVQTFYETDDGSDELALKYQVTISPGRKSANGYHAKMGATTMKFEAREPEARPARGADEHAAVEIDVD